MGVPPVLIHFLMGFSIVKTIHSVGGTPQETSCTEACHAWPHA